jgi:hypothetical protein
MRLLQRTMVSALTAGVAVALAQGCGGSSGVVPNEPVEDAAPHDSATTSTPDARADSATPPADATADTGSSTPDAAGEGGGPDTGSDAQICNAVDNVAPAITSTASDAGVLPASTGMTIAGGTYFLTSATSYGGPAGACGGISVRGTTIVTATNATSGVLDGVITYSLSVLQQTTTVHALYTTSGSSLSLTATCPTNDAGPEITMYSATANTITVVQPAPPQVAQCGTIVEVFTKQ